MNKKSSKKTYIIALIFFASGLGYLAWSGFAEGRMPFVNVAEALAVPAGERSRAKLFGTVSGQGLAMKNDGLGARFQLMDKDNTTLTLWVDYQGALPDTFQEGAEVIVEGRWQEPSVFNATSVITKCPSKYEKANRENT